MLTEHMRTDVIRPFAVDPNPRFMLNMYKTSKHDGRGRGYVGYQLVQCDEGHPPITLFEGEDYLPSPLEQPFGDGSAVDLLYRLVAEGYVGKCAHMEYFFSHYAEWMLLAADEMLEPEPIVSSEHPPPIEA